MISFNPYNNPKQGLIVFMMKKMRFRKVKWFAQGHAANKQNTLDWYIIL